jgi:hypothetical protein
MYPNIEFVETYCRLTANHAARDCISKQRTSPFAKLYLYYFPTDGVRFGNVICDTDKNIKGAILAKSERINPSFTVHQISALIYDTLQHCPIVPTKLETI